MMAYENNPPPGVVECEFQVRVPTQGGYHYDRVWLSNSEGDGVLRTPFPPDVGDTLFLWDRGGTETGPRGMFKVVERSWSHSSYGSVNWPLIKMHPDIGPRLTLIVEPDTGPYRLQVLRPEEE